MGTSTSTTDVTALIPVIQDLITKGVNALVVPGYAAIVSELKKAKAAGIPVIYYASGFGPRDPDNAYAKSTVITDNYVAGEQAAGQVKQALNNKGTVAIIDITTGISPLVDQRLYGFKAGLKGSGVKIVTEVSGGVCEPPKAFAAAQNLLTKYPSIGAIFGECGEDALSAEKAMQQAHISPSKIDVVGLDGLEPEIQSIIAGQESATVAQYPYKMAEIAVHSALQVLNGHPVATNINSGSVLIDKSNAQEELKALYGTS